MFVTHITFKTESVFCVLSFPSFKIDCLVQSLKIACVQRERQKTNNDISRNHWLNVQKIATLLEKKTLAEAQQPQGYARSRLILPQNPDLAPTSTEAVSKKSLGDPLAHIVNLSANRVQQTHHWKP